MASVVTYVTGPIGQIFLRLLFMLVIPLLFSALVVGIAEMGEIRALKSVGIKTLVYTVIVSTIAVAVSIAMVNLIRPGDGVDPAAARDLLAQGGEGAASILARSAESPSGVDAVIGLVPSNIVSAMSKNDILAVMFFALFFGIGLLLVQTRRTETLKDAIEGRVRSFDEADRHRHPARTVRHLLFHVQSRRAVRLGPAGQARRFRRRGAARARGADVRRLPGAAQVPGEEEPAQPSSARPARRA